MRTFWNISPLLLFAAVATRAADPSPSFIGLGDLAGGTIQSSAFGISSDGNWIAGQSESTLGIEGVRWESTGSATPIGDLAGGPFRSRAGDVSAGGSFACGSSAISTSGISQIVASRWIAGVGLTKIGALPGIGFTTSEGLGISDNGLKVVGYSTTYEGIRAFLWTATGTTTGTMVSLGALPPPTFPQGDQISYYSSAEDISADGTVVVGTSSYVDARSVPPSGNETPPPIILSQGSDGCRWSGSSKVRLPDLAGGPRNAQALAISDDKLTIVGTGTDLEGQKGVIWTNNLPTSVGDLPGDEVYCRLLAVNGDGSIAGGEGTDSTGRVAVIWDATYGLRKLSTLLDNAGIDTSGWTLSVVTGISSDGDSITGNATNPAGKAEAWHVSGLLALLEPPEPPTPEIRFTMGRMIQFPVEANHAYQVLRSTATSTWQPLGDPFSTLGLADAETHTVHDPDPAAPGVSYQVTVLDPAPGMEDPTPSVLEGAIVSFQTEPGFTYQLERSLGLESWTPLEPVINSKGDGRLAERAIFDPFEALPAPLDPRRYYRLRTEVAP